MTFRTKTLKYIIVKNKFHELAILFDIRLVHSSVYNNKDEIVSAGFCYLKYDNAFIIETYGKSESLGIESHIDDRDIIYRTMIAGAWDYGVYPGEPLYEKIQELIKEKGNS